MVEDTPRRANDHLGAAIEGVNLVFVPDAPVNRHDFDACVAEDCFRFGIHLDREFPGRHEDQNLTRAHGPVDHLSQREEEGARLAAACLGLDHDVPAGKEVGNRAGLDGHEINPTGASCRLANHAGKRIKSDGVKVGFSVLGGVVVGLRSVMCGIRRGVHVRYRLVSFRVRGVFHIRVSRPK